MSRTAVLAALALVFTAGAACAQPHYTGAFETRWEEDGRHMVMLSPVAYVDAKGQTWAVPVGAELDGASIPRWAWTFIGGPFEGKYRNASVIHDWFCDHRVHTWQDTDRMFFEAMLTSGVDPLQAQTMYFAVLVGGPRWDEQAMHNAQLADQGAATAPAPKPLADLGALLDDKVMAAHELETARMAFVQVPNAAWSTTSVSPQYTAKREAFYSAANKFDRLQRSFDSTRLETLHWQAVADLKAAPAAPPPIDPEDRRVKSALDKVKSTPMSPEEIVALAATLTNTATATTASPSAPGR